jgi:NitT/TauT family transport system ATP-binding protein
MTRLLRIGFMPLTDAGLLCVAAEKKFDREEGLRFELTPEPSWANLRDKLALGIYDAAHMLAPAVVASAIGLDGFPAPMIGAAALGLDGNAISVAPALAAALREKRTGDAADPRRTGAALAQVVAERAAKGLPPLRFAHVFPYSAHHYQLRLWLRAGGVDPDGVQLTVTPPPLMQQAIAGGYIDGFCVGEPWNSLAQESGASEILHSCRDLTADCPEKVLAFRAEEARQEPELPRAAARAVRRAALWGEAKENRPEFCRIIAERTGAGATEAMVAASLDARWLRLDAAATALAGPQAIWLYVLMVAAGQAAPEDTQAAHANEAFWPLDGAPARPSASIFGIEAFESKHWREALAALTLDKI